LFFQDELAAIEAIQSCEVIIEGTFMDMPHFQVEKNTTGNRSSVPDQVELFKTYDLETKQCS
jgi:hypothetical protein